VTTKTLNPRQERFCQLYVTSGNATQSYLKAGYDTNPHAARVTSTHLLAKPSIQERVAEIQALVSRPTILTRAEYAEIVTGIARDEANKPLDRTRAGQALAALQGWDAPAKKLVVHLTADDLPALLEASKAREVELLAEYAVSQDGPLSGEFIEVTEDDNEPEEDG